MARNRISLFLIENLPENRGRINQRILAQRSEKNGAKKKVLFVRGAGARGCFKRSFIASRRGKSNP